MRVGEVSENEGERALSVIIFKSGSVKVYGKVLEGFMEGSCLRSVSTSNSLPMFTSSVILTF